MRSVLRSHLWWHCWAVVTLLAPLEAASRANEWQPYEARVMVARAQVRSGPGENFYPTSTLAQGETVEVYREQSGGWLAIRPPNDSFSWVAERYLKLLGDGLAEVAEDNAASRIGTQFGDKRNAVQIRLRKGEIVEVLGKDRTGNDTWYRISPPAGEFRWLQATQVRILGPLAQSLDEIEAEPLVVVTSATENKATADLPASSTDQNAASDDSWRASGASGASDSNSNSSNFASPPLAPSTTPTRASLSNPNSTSPQSDSTRQLTEIEMQLSRMVAESPTQWNTELLARQAEELLGRTQSSSDREAIKRLLVKIDRFEVIARQYKQGAEGIGVGGNAALTATQTTPIGPLQAVGQDSALRPTLMASEAGRYDAVGILRPVVSKRPGAPQFALVDDRGQVISFVTPTPDMNLEPFLGHRVGVVGTRGFIPEFQRAHVTAGRVSPINERLIR